jgi:sugar lactone lactonase YvrE
MKNSRTPTRRKVLLGLGTAGVASLAGCGAGNTDGQENTATEATPEPTATETETATSTPTATPTPSTANLRVVHASPNAPTVDVYVDGDAVLEGVEFGAVSGYLEVPAGDRAVDITAAGDSDSVVFSGDVGVEANTDYTVVAAGEIGDMADEAFTPLILTDDNSDPGDDTARVQLVHASPDAPAVDITVAGSGDTLFDGVAFGESGAVEVPAGEYTIQVRGDTENNDGDVVAEYDLTLEGGTIYTGLAVGYLSPDDEPADTPFNLLVATPDGTVIDAPTPGAATSTVETVVSIPGDRVPENMAFDTDGNLYFGITAGEVRRLSADQTSSTDLSLDATEQIATLPGAIGVEVGPDGTVYVAVATQDENAGVWEVPPEGEATQLVEISGFPNDLIFDAERDRLLVTESTGGVVYAVGTDGSRETWLDDDRLATESFGANGITRDGDGNVYVAVTRAANQTGRLLQVPVQADGSAGEATMFFEGEEIFGADGITAREGAIFVAANSQNRIVRVGEDGSTTTVANANDGLVFPSDVLFAPDSSDLFICNFANQSPENGAILRTRL